MEGRAIARPNLRFLQSQAGKIDLLQWRAGQLPGQTCFSQASVTDEMQLQWRAGQLPGQTGVVGADPVGLEDASMEGRAIARPNWWWWSGPPPPCGGFNGGPGNCPAKPLDRRAGPRDPMGASMEGRAIARPNMFFAGVGHR